MNDKASLIKLGALWNNKSANGGTFLSGGDGGVKYLVLPNQNKDKSTSPDYYLFVTQREQKPKEVPAKAYDV